jgi:hypothetical protein
MSGILYSTRSGQDKCGFQATLDAPMPSGGTFVGILMNGDLVALQLDSHGVAQTRTESVRLKKVKKRGTSIMTANVKLSHGSWFGGWSSRLIAGRAAMDVNLIIQGRRYRQVADSRYTQKNGQTKLKYKK